jgi:hypothetical protein
LQPKSGHSFLPPAAHHLFKAKDIGNTEGPNEMTTDPNASDSSPEQSIITLDDGIRAAGRRSFYDIMNEPEMTLTDACETLLARFPRNAVIEVRVIKAAGGIYGAGWFDDAVKMAAAVAKVDGKHGVYFTINPVDPALLAQAPNVIVPLKNVTGDAHVVRRTSFAIDFDPQRPSGADGKKLKIPASEGAHHAAIAVAESVKRWLATYGWPDPMVVDSGNGAWLHYYVNLPNDDDSKTLVDRCLRAVKRHVDENYPRAKVDVDTSIGNAARVGRLPGTMNVKGAPVPEQRRHHRRARILALGAHALVRREMLEMLAALAPVAETAAVKTKGKKNSARPLEKIDVTAWCERFGIAIAPPAAWRDGVTRWRLLDGCLFCGEKDGEPYITQQTEGALGYGCFKTGCAGHNVEWSDVRAKVGDVGPMTLGSAMEDADFYAYLPKHTFIYRRTREHWPATTIDKILGAGSSARLDRTRAVVQQTWMPGEDEVVEGRVIAGEEWTEDANARVYNLYRPPTIVPGNSADAGPWLRLAEMLFPDDAERRHAINWLAHRVQRPAEKINHALVIGGGPGIGKDSFIQAVVPAIGSWNVKEIGPSVLFEAFNEYLTSVVCRISEVKDQGEVNRYQLYERTKTLFAAPPNMLPINEKFVGRYQVPNVVGFILTTNHRDGLYLPADDRRHFVAWSDAARPEEVFFTDYYDWLYKRGGAEAVAGYLRALDLSAWNPKAQPPKTPAFWAMVAAESSPASDALGDAIEMLGSPKVLTVADIIDSTTGTFAEWARDGKNARALGHKLTNAGYVVVPNPDAAKETRWRVPVSKDSRATKQMTVYAQASLDHRERIAASRAYVGGGRFGRQGDIPF